jgi:hypothetical protein
MRVREAPKGRGWRAIMPRRCRAAKRVSFYGHAVRALDLWVELRRLMAVGHAVVANDANPSVAQLAKVSNCDWCPPPGRFGIPLSNEKQ